MPDDAIASVAQHSSRLQPSIILQVPVTTSMFSCSGTDVLSRRDEGLNKPCKVIEPHRILARTQDLSPATGFIVKSSDHYTTTSDTMYQYLHYEAILL